MTAEPDLVLRYADHADGIVDVHLPSATAFAPLLVLVHGGFWRAEWDRTHVRDLADAFRREGFVVASPEYRRTGAGGGWPTTFDDVARAVRSTRGLVAEHGVGISTTTVAGHSAGGHLALWLAAQDLPLDRVVALAPVGDLRDADARNLGDGAVRALLGGPVDVPEADPARLLEHDPGCPVVVLHGTEDVEVPVANSLGWANAHPYVDLRVLDGVDHFALVEPTSAVWPEVLRAVVGD